MLNAYHGQNYSIALDDFGECGAGIRVLYEQRPDYLKIHRGFVSGITEDGRKRQFVAQVVNMAHTLGITVVAEGVETESELMTCREIGCDLAQGFLICQPTVRPEEILATYPDMAPKGRRGPASQHNDRKFISDQMDPLPSLAIDTGMKQVFEFFRRNTRMTFCPVVDGQQRPMGILREKDLKSYTYSEYGRDLMFNKAFGKSLRDFIAPCPLSDINADAETILANFSQNDVPEGILITEDFAYRGFLSTGALLRVINEKNLVLARDQNPLTRLPGNTMIQAYLSDALGNKSCDAVLVYFDFDNFKPFNDVYGFRQGDRAILLFAELMRKHLDTANGFIAHVGGDDFFAAYREEDPRAVEERIRVTQQAFAQDVESFYNARDRERGSIETKDRNGDMRQFPLLTASAALLDLPAGRTWPPLDDVIEYFGTLKKQAKRAHDKMCHACLI